MEALSGTIRRIEDNRAAVQFDTPLYGPIVEHLCSRFGSGEPVTFKPL